MGNTESVSNGNKAQVDTNACEWYKLLNLGGGKYTDRAMEMYMYMYNNYCIV